jgi:hypothetical protein
MTLPALDPSLYPRTYRTSAGAAAGLFLAMIGYFLVTALGRGNFIRGASLHNWEFLLGCLCLVIVLALNLVRARITLYADRIERQTWFGREVMLRSDIKGLRMGGLWESQCLKHKDIAAFSFAVPRRIKKDASWDTWMASVPDLDALDEIKILADEKGYPRLGTTTQQRKYRWELANSLAKICASVAFAATVLVFVPYLSSFAATALIIIPWIVLYSMNLYGVTFNSAGRNPLYGNSLTLFVSGVGLGVFGALYPEMAAIPFIPPGTKKILYLVAGPTFGLVLLLPTFRVVFAKSQWKDLSSRVTAAVFLVPWMILLAWGYGIGTALEIKITSGF